jgi:hypothetical protein
MPIRVGTTDGPGGGIRVSSTEYESWIGAFLISGSVENLIQTASGSINTTAGIRDISGSIVNYNQSPSGTVEIVNIPAGWTSILLVAPLADSGDRITAIPDLEGGDTLWYDTVGNTVEVFSDGSFSAAEGVTSFDVRALSAEGELGDVATQDVENPGSGEITGSLTNYIQTVSGTMINVNIPPVDVELSGSVSNPIQTVSGNVIAYLPRISGSIVNYNQIVSGTISNVDLPENVIISGVVTNLIQTATGTVTVENLEPFEGTAEATSVKMPGPMRRGFLRR